MTSGQLDERQRTQDLVAPIPAVGEMVLVVAKHRSSCRYGLVSTDACARVIRAAPVSMGEPVFALVAAERFFTLIEQVSARTDERTDAKLVDRA